MRKFLLSLFVAIATATVPMHLNATTPVISPAPGNPNADENGDVWYYIQFLDILDLVVFDAELLDGAAIPAFPVKDKTKQLWKLTLAETVGDINYYRLVNKTGSELLSYYGSYFTIVPSAGETTSAVFSIKELTGNAIQLYRKGQTKTVIRTDYKNAQIGNQMYGNIYETASTDSLRFVLPKDMVYPAASFSSATSPVWYYIQFLESGKVFQDNGENLRLTAETAVKNQDTQLWRIAYDDKLTNAGALYNGSYSIVNKSTGHKIFYYASTTGTPVPPDGNGFYSLSGSTSYSGTTAPRKCDIAISGTSFFPVSESLTGNYPGILLHGNWNNVTSYGNYYTSVNENNKIVSGTVSDQVSLRFVTPSDLNFIPSITAGSFQVYPNPATDYIRIDFPEGAATVSIINATGQTVVKTKLSGSVKNIPVSNLSSGLYIVKIEKNSGVETAKFIKK
jgi:hypothetical protein